MQQLSRRSRLLVGLTLFSMFFGAGNLIFPPFLGTQAGAATWIAMAGFALTAVGFPILGVIAVSRAGGLDQLAGRVCPPFAFGFTLLIYLSIGPGLAIPRTASTSFDMAVLPFLPEGTSVTLPLALYSAVFFAVALSLALRPEKLSDRLGKITTPCLLFLLLIILAACLIRPMGAYAAPTGDYASAPLIAGFLGGYQTMDTIAALNFGIVITLNIRARGVTEPGSIMRETMRAGLLAGGLLLVIYAALAHFGALTSGAASGAENGAQTLTFLVDFLFGPVGSALLAAIFVLACMNTCVGLLSCCSEYFSTLCPRLGYRGWVILFAVVSLLVSNLGLTRILALSVPVLNAIYPVAIVLILLALLHRWLGRFPLVYPAAILCTGVVSVLCALVKAKVPLLQLGALVQALPLYEEDLAWLLPAAAGLLAGVLLSLFCPKVK